MNFSIVFYLLPSASTLIFSFIEKGEAASNLERDHLLENFHCVWENGGQEEGASTSTRHLNHSPVKELMKFGDSFMDDVHQSKYH